MSVGLWTDGEVTIVLAHVSAAFWAEDDVDDDDDTVPWHRCDPRKATSLVIQTAGGGETVLREDKDWRDRAVSFLRALSLYWETRS